MTRIVDLGVGGTHIRAPFSVSLVVVAICVEVSAGKVILRPKKFLVENSKTEYHSQHF
jgi:hypothetical protein